ncbi:cystathionine gamma-synthase [Hypoxylon sp. FL1284]|nr:cystathionine gamma-synthase [Hypoxylon sp. FL1284]
MAGEEIPTAGQGVSVEAPAQPELVNGMAHEDSVVVDNGDATDTEPATATTLAARLRHLSLSAQTIHADDFLNSHQAVAPPMHVSTTFRYSDDPDKLRPWANVNPNNPFDSHVYSRDTAPNTTRLEAVLTSILGGPALTYSSGLSAFHALLVYLNPRVVAIGAGYHGCHGVLRVLAKLTELRTVDLDADFAAEGLGPGDVVHVETPLNPTGEARDLAAYAAKARARGCVLTVDATFAPPPLLEPFRWGADAVVHSGTKYFGGHSDMLCGVVAVNPCHSAGGSGGKEDWIRGLRDERLVLGSVMGSFEGWLGVRSLRTLEVRVRRQSADAAALVAWLAGACGQEQDSSSSSTQTIEAVRDTVLDVRHASLQARRLAAAAAEKGDDGEKSWLAQQMPRGFGPVFAARLRDADLARRLPSKLRLFHHATSLGGVESLVEWRAMTDAGVDPRLLRFSIGLEGFEDLRDDLLQGLEALRAEKRSDAAPAAGSDGADVVGGV